MKLNKTNYPAFLPVLLLSLFSFLQETDARWVRAAGPAGGDISSLTQDGETLFAGTFRHIYRSTDHGTMWSEADSGFFQNTWAKALAVCGEAILAATDDYGVFRSTDKGTTWTVSSDGLTCSNITGLGTVDSIVLAGTRAGIFISADSGATWAMADSGHPDSGIIAFTKIGTSLIAGGYSGLYRSTDGARHWSRVDTAVFARNWFSCMVSIGSNVIAYGGYGAFLSRDSGMTWHEVDLPGETGILTFAVKTPLLFAGTQDGTVFCSADSGAHWIETGNSGLPADLINTLLYDGNVLFAGTRSGVYTSVDEAKTWTVKNNGLYCTDATSFSVFGPNVFAGTSGSGIFVSGDSGATWKQVNDGLRNFFVSSITTQGTAIFAGASDSIYRSIDSGKSWTPFIQGLTGRFVDCLAASDSMVYAFNGDGVFRLGNTGIWTPANSGLPQAGTPLILHADGSRIFAGTYDGIYVSEDNAANWVQIHASLDPKSIATLGSRIFIGTNGQGILISSDGGRNWTNADSSHSTFGNASIQSFATVGDNLFAGTGSGVFFSTDYGAHWTRVDGLDSYCVNTLTPVGNYLIAGTGAGGVWRLPISSIAVKKGFNSGPPSAVAVIRASASCRNILTVKIVLDRKSNVGMWLYDLAGHEIAALEHGFFAAGQHSIHLKTGSLPAGSYVVKIQIDKQIVSRLFSIIR